MSAPAPAPYTEAECRRCGVALFYRDGRWHAVILGSCGDVCPSEPEGIVRADHDPGSFR